MADVTDNGHQRSSAERRLWSTFVVLLFAVWWGGLTFYAAIVVPIGGEQIGETEQGFVTQQVTRWHNALLTAMTVCLLIEACRQKRWPLWAVVCGLGVINAALLYQHLQLTTLMDMRGRSVSNDFYAQHAIYLWLTTVEWVIGLAIPFQFGDTSDGSP